MPTYAKSTRAIAPALLCALLAACGTSGSRPPAPPTPAAGLEPAATPSASSAAALELPEAAVAAYQRALAAMTGGAFADAGAQLEQLTAEYPALTGPWVNLAIVYRRAGRDEDAERALERALALDPSHPAANNEIGILNRERGDFAAAESAYRRAIAADPGYALAHYNLGVLLDLYLQRSGEALEQYELYQALAAEPDPAVDFWVVDLRRRLGRPPEPVQLAQENAP